MNCKFCQKSFPIHIGAHERCCLLNPARDEFLAKLEASSIKAAQIKKEEWDDIFVKIKSIIKSKNGKCLSEEYLGYMSK